jgi:tetrahydroxynaphthalene reductase
MALELGRRGAKVIVNYANSQESAEEVVSLIKKNGSDAACIKANVSDVDQIVELFEQAVKVFGKLNIVCSNSGVVSFGHVKDVTPEEFDRVFNINTRGQFFVAREAYKHLEVGGRLILMGSITGQAKGVPKHAVYSGSKGTIETFVRCMAIGAYLHLIITLFLHETANCRCCCVQVGVWSIRGPVYAGHGNQISPTRPPICPTLSP